MEREVYCQLVATAKSGFLGSKVTIELDTGEGKSFWKSLVGDPMKDEDGKVIIFNSVIDALNHMASKDWKFVNAYAISDGSSNVYHYVMKKVVTAE